jgi:hypothetical protein
MVNRSDNLSANNALQKDCSDLFDLLFDLFDLLFDLSDHRQIHKTRHQ